MEKTNRLLIVEDDENTTRTLLFIFESKGFWVETAFNGEQAREKIQHGTFHLALVDIRLPDMEGVALIEPLREADPDLVVIVMTGHATMETAIRALNAGASAYITKPFNIDEMFVTIRQALERRNLVVENRKLLETVQQQTYQLDLILSTIPDGILLLNHSYCVQHANPTGSRYLKTLANAKVGDVITHLANQPIAESLNNITESNQLWHELEFVAEKRFFDLGVSSLTSEPSQNGWVLVLREVTEERERQKYLNAQERLATVGQLAAGIAHDFNNVLGVITLYSDLLLSTATLSPTNEDRLYTIKKQAHHAAELTSQILDISRRSIIKRKPIDMVPFFKELVKLLRRTMPENILIDFEYEKDPYVVNGDNTRLHQAFMNLCINARDAMPDGGNLQIYLTDMTLSSHMKTPLPNMPTGRWLMIQFNDSGIGINEENLHKVLEPFFTTKPPTQGTGLGLAQVYGIVRQHDGYLDLSSEVGEGTTITIYLPLILTETGSLIPQMPDNNHAVQGKGENILIVEDEKEIRIAMCDALEILGYTVVVAQNSEEALIILDHYAPEDIALVVSDMVMPGMGGEAFFQILSRRKPRLKMLFVTGYPLNERGQDLLKQDNVSWLSKPFTNEAFAEAVRNSIET
ncbi:response regulator [Candidatus Leptofilum sp.]|uniref:ATP-binding response regulator n=1 Tax=Candidatus Leptofilum sp. TaxID=3241576 RepID=UPI003B58CD46